MQQAIKCPPTVAFVPDCCYSGDPLRLRCVDIDEKLGTQSHHCIAQDAPHDVRSVRKYISGRLDGMDYT